jgi:translation initiation factor IF-2
MTEDKKNDNNTNKTLKLKTLSVKKPSEVRQNLTQGQSKSVEVEVVKKRRSRSGTGRRSEAIKAAKGGATDTRTLTSGEKDARFKAVQEALKREVELEKERQRKKEEKKKREAQERIDAETRRLEEEALKKEEEKKAREEIPAPKTKESVASKKTFQRPQTKVAPTITPPLPLDDNALSKHKGHKIRKKPEDITKDEPVVFRRKAEAAASTPADLKKAVKKTKDVVVTNKGKKVSGQALTRALDGDEMSRTRSIASMRRAQQKQKRQINLHEKEAVKIVREVTIPDVITVGELANRMAVRGADVVKSLMKLGVMATINQSIDSDTAELVCEEFGHKPKRVSESDVELGMLKTSATQNDSILESRAPVVTIMGHVDHGKTSLLDALRQTNVVGGEAGGITQHIGAYQVAMSDGQKITFLDTPGHAAFSQMRARGAHVTDIVVLVVAADDGIMEQTKEAINHAKAANVPIIVAINKMDKPDANPARVKEELLSYELVVEEYGGSVLAIEVSAKNKTNLDKLEEAILLQAEILQLEAQSKRSAEGIIIESRVDRGRGIIATLLVQQGTFKTGDVFVAGSQWGKVRALINDRGERVDEAGPSVPVEVLGLNGVPSAGDELVVVDDEAKAREVSEYRQRKERESQNVAKTHNTIEQMMSKIAAGQVKELPVVIKSDVQGSLEAITQSLAKLATEEVSVRVLHGGVGGINESDITLARASDGIVIGFNVRANPQAREQARRDGVDMRYYNIIYNVIDEMKALMGGLLSPVLQEKYLGTAEIREIFTVGKTLRIGGCYVTEGVVKRGSKVRLLRDNVVIHEGSLKTLRRFKDEVKEVKQSYECGMAFEKYNDIKEGDMVECYETQEIAREL